MGLRGARREADYGADNVETVRAVTVGYRAPYQGACDEYPAVGGQYLPEVVVGLEGGNKAVYPGGRCHPHRSTATPDARAHPARSARLPDFEKGSHEEEGSGTDNEHCRPF